MHGFFMDVHLLASQNPFLAYFIIYLSIIFLGNLAVFTLLWLVVRGLLGPHGLPLFIMTTFAADVSADLLWYWLGRKLRETGFGEVIRNMIPRHHKIEEHLHENAPKWIFLAKFLYASNFPIIFMVGWTKINFRRFFKVALIAMFTWLLFLLIISSGLIAGLNSLAEFKIVRFEKIFVVGILAFIIVNFLAKRLLKGYVGKSLAEKISSFLNHKI